VSRRLSRPPEWSVSSCVRATGFEIVPPLANPSVPRPAPQDSTPETPRYPILRGLSRPRFAALHLLRGAPAGAAAARWSVLSQGGGAMQRTIFLAKGRLLALLSAGKSTRRLFSEAPGTALVKTSFTPVRK